MKKSFFLRVVLVLVAINAAFGIWALLGGDMGDTEGKVLATSLLATMGAVIALVCAPAASAKRAWFVPQIGILAAASATAIFIGAVWTEAADDWFKIGGTALVVAITAALVSLLSGWPGFGVLSWVRPTAMLLAAVGAGFIIFSMWADADVPELYWTAFGIVMVLLAAFAIATPVVHRMSDSSDPQPYGHCPFCGATVTGMVGRTMTCPSCNRKYEVGLR